MAEKSRLECWIACLMAEKEINSYKIVKCRSIAEGDGYMGNVDLVELIATLASGKQETYNVVIKSAVKIKDVRIQRLLDKALEREIFMYTKILPTFQEFQAERVINPFDKFPVFHHECNSTGEKAVILEDLNAFGFKVRDKRLPHDLDHALLVFRSYAKFHAVSLALKIKKPKLFVDLTENLTHALGELLVQTNFIPNVIAKFSMGIDELKKCGREDVFQKFYGFQDQMEKYLTEYTEPSSPTSVILHGDCWNNNMMFKYKENLKLADMRFIDLQFSRVSSPILDLSYYLYTCGDKPVLDHFDDLLKAYCSTISDSLKEFDCDPHILTFEKMKALWNIYGRFGLSLAPFILSRLGLNEVGGNQEPAEDIFSQRLVELFSHFAEHFM